MPSLNRRRFRLPLHPAGRRRVALQVEPMERRVVMTTTQYQLFDTGVTSAGALLAAGAADTHYSLSPNQDGSGGVAAVVPTNNYPLWVANTAKTQWISPSLDQQSGGGSLPGNYYYTTTVVVPTGGGLAHLSGQFAADDALVDVYINGNSTGLSGATYTQTTGFSINPYLPGGTNSITFRVNNIQDASETNPTGLFLSGLTLNFSPTVAVDQPTATVAYGGTATLTGTFGDFDNGDVVALKSSQGTVTESTTNPGTFTFTQSGVTASGPVTITATDLQGNVQTTTFNVNVTPFLTSGGGATPTATTGGSGVVINPNLTINTPGLATLTGASVSIGSNFTPGEDRLLFTDQNGIAGSYNATTGVLTLTGSATPAQYQAALRSVQYQDTNTNPVTANRATRGFNFVLGSALYNATTGHFYQFVAAPGISWTDAEAAAQASSLFGASGHLATITSAAENQPFVTGQVSGWIGANDAQSPGTWIYSDGPEAGTQFWQGFANGSAVNGQYNNWASGQPTATSGANYVALVNGQWVNQANDATTAGYLVEYDNAPSGLALASLVNVASTSDTPVVTSPSVPTQTNATTITVGGTADAGSLVQLYFDANLNGQIDSGETVFASEQLAAGQTAYSIPITLLPNAAYPFLVTATVAGAAESAPAVVPRILQDSIAPQAPVVTSPAAASTLVNVATATVTGTAGFGTLVRIYRNDGAGNPTGTVLAEFQLGTFEAGFSLTVPLVSDAANNFVVTATDAAGNASGATTVPTITQQSTVTVAGRVFLDLNADGIQEAGEPGFPGRVVFISLDGSGIYKQGDPTATTGADGSFSLADLPPGLGQPIDLIDQAIADRYARIQTSTVDGEVRLAVVPFSPIFPVSLVPTFVTVNNPATIDAYVQSLYNVLLHRNGSSAELTAWFNAYRDQKVTIGDIASRFVNSPEHRLDQVIGYYRDFLGRQLDPLAQGWIDQLSNGVSEQTVVEGILASTEYQQAAGRSDAATYVRDLYLDVLGRQAGDSEVAGWVNVLGSGLSRQTVADLVVGSPEAAEHLVTSFYVHFLRRQREAGTTSTIWLDELAQGTSAGDVALGILVSAEFQNKTVGPLN